MSKARVLVRGLYAYVRAATAFAGTAANSAGVRLPISSGTTPRRYESIGARFTTRNPESVEITAISPLYFFPSQVRKDVPTGRARISERISGEVCRTRTLSKVTGNS